MSLVPTVKVIDEVREAHPELHMVTFKYQEQMSHEDWSRLLDNPPGRLLDHDPTEFDALGVIVGAGELESLFAEH